MVQACLGQKYSWRFCSCLYSVRTKWKRGWNNLRHVLHFFLLHLHLMGNILERGLSRLCMCHSVFSCIFGFHRGLLLSFELLGPRFWYKGQKRCPAIGSPCLQHLKILNCSVWYPFTTLTLKNMILVSEFPSRMFIHFQNFHQSQRFQEFFGWI